jgi:hypothetical protein
MLGVVVSTNAEAREFKLGLITPPTHIWTASAESFGAALQQATDGRLSLTVYPAQQLGNEAQKIVIRSTMPGSGPIPTEGRISAVWDKGKAALIDIEVSSDIFTASYRIFRPGLGGWGGERTPLESRSEEETEINWSDSYATNSDRATLYRLTGDCHPVHIDTEVAKAYGLDRPILHGLCTLGIPVRALVGAANSLRVSLRELETRLAARGDLQSDYNVGRQGTGWFFAL